MSHGVLTREQLGHLRHWDNLSCQLPNDWSLMQGKGVSQDDFGGYRFQLAYTVYGLALAHRHRLLFGTDHYAAPGSLTFRHWSFFWGGPEKRFAHDRDSLTEHLYWLMVESGYLGVACEPNCVREARVSPAAGGRTRSGTKLVSAIALHSSNEEAAAEDIPRC